MKNAKLAVVPKNKTSAKTRDFFQKNTIGSMYCMIYFPAFGLFFMVNVGKYTIHDPYMDPMFFLKVLKEMSIFRFQRLLLESVTWDAKLVPVRVTSGIFTCWVSPTEPTHLPRLYPGRTNLHPLCGPRYVYHMNHICYTYYWLSINPDFFVKKHLVFLCIQKSLPILGNLFVPYADVGTQLVLGHLGHLGARYI